MKLRTRLLLSPGISVALLVMLLAASIAMLRSVQSGHRETSEAIDAADAALARSELQLTQAHATVYRTVALIGSMQDPAIKQMRQKQAADVAAVANEAGTLAGTDPEGQKIAAALKAALAKYAKAADDAIDLSTVDVNTGMAALQTVDSGFTTSRASIDELKTLLKQRAVARVGQLDSNARGAVLLMIVLAVAGCCAVIGFSWITQRRILADLDEGARSAQQVADGRLDVTITSRHDDELGELLRSLGHMVGRLRESIHTVRTATDSIDSASTEIASGNLDLSNRTELAASNLQQTASSMQQLTETVRQSADAAAQANQLAASASLVASRGGAVVSKVVETMDEITTSSRRIADIIGVIDGIAFQTNILALNAAVEAARAGEQGRGFAVVASEVRSLAQRSAAAAKEIKGLIGSSVERVEAGSKLVADAGATMDEIVASVKRVSDMIGEITAASGEQSQGIVSINQAVGQLDQMTQQNAALVEQSAAAAASLTDQTARLASVVANFQLGAESTPPAAAATARPTFTPPAATRSAVKPTPPRKPRTPAVDMPAHQAAASQAIAQARQSARTPAGDAPSAKADDQGWASF